MSTIPLKEIVRERFYDRPDYLAKTAREFAQKSTLPPIYTHTTEATIARIAKTLFSIIVLPVGLCQLFHRLVGKIFIHASSPFIQKYLLRHEIRSPHEARPRIVYNNPHFGFKRITVMSDGHAIDAMIVINKNAPKKRWGLFNSGSGEIYEHTLSSNGFAEQLLMGINGNGIFFNYPGVGASSGLPSKGAMIKAYKAMLTMLEDKEKGIGADEIIAYSHSFVGGGVQGEALLTYKLKEKIRYIFVKDRTPSSIANIASSLSFLPLGFLVKLFGWDFSSEASSKKLAAPEIILQTAMVRSPEILNSSYKIMYDGCILKNATLAKLFLDKGHRQNKIIFGIPEPHDEPITNTLFLSKAINEILENKPLI